MRLEPKKTDTLDIVKYSISTDDPEDVDRMKSHLQKHGKIIQFIPCKDGAVFLVKHDDFFYRNEYQ